MKIMINVWEIELDEEDSISDIHAAVIEKLEDDFPEWDMKRHSSWMKWNSTARLS